MAATVITGYAGAHASIAAGALAASNPMVINALGGPEYAASWGAQIASAGVAATKIGAGSAVVGGSGGIVNTIHNAQI